MLPTPSTAHVDYDQVYEPAEDSFLLLDTLSSPTETTFLRRRFEQHRLIGTFDPGESTHLPHEQQPSSTTPLVVEIGTGSGVVLAFLTAHAQAIFGRADVLTLGTDVNAVACAAAARTVTTALTDNHEIEAGGLRGALPLDPILADLSAPLRSGVVDVLVFNPPYVPTASVPNPSRAAPVPSDIAPLDAASDLLALSYAGGVDGMEVADRLLEQLPGILSFDRGVAYILLCAHNKPENVKRTINSWPREWKVETVGSSGNRAGWEKLQIIRVWRDIM
ncbi:MAG: S-adenosylmethionine-dependent methyltransferase [Caeruleum heppii]|nr:MAG: S-adenosylmethionine-dependent methyltransferase [Caeruleum heppii]